MEDLRKEYEQIMRERDKEIEQSYDNNPTLERRYCMFCGGLLHAGSWNWEFGHHIDGCY